MNEARIHQYLELIQKLLSCPYITTIVQNLCIDITNFPLGTRGNNLEIAITGYETVLTLCPRAAFPQDWAMTQNNLGNAYKNRIKGDRGENIEQAIAAYNLALDVYTRAAFPEKWATTQNNLAIAYKNRIKGDRGENIELAIKYYENALEIHTPESLPINCLQTGNNLGDLGFQEGNWQLAIRGYE
ncbi:MAG: hypothetical protein ACKPBV_25805, partial [Sphaerospermopsis kisseleviana]